MTNKQERSADWRDKHRKQKREEHVRGLRAVRDAAVVRVPVRAEPSNYFPHQGPRECARRLRQLAKLNDRPR